MAYERTTVVPPVEADHPLHRVRVQGAGVLSNAELIALVVCGGVKLGRRVLRAAQYDVHAFQQLGWGELACVRGMSSKRCGALLAAFELVRRCRPCRTTANAVITDSASAFAHFAPAMRHLRHEELWVLLLDGGRRVLRTEMVSRGGSNGTVADPKMIFRAAMRAGACALLVAHNHPSGTLRPSTEDVLLTRKLVELGEMMELPVLDHLIVAGDHYFSFLDHDLM